MVKGNSDNLTARLCYKILKKKLKLLERYKIRKKAKYIPESKLVNCVQSYVNGLRLCVIYKTCNFLLLISDGSIYLTTRIS